MSTQDPPKKPAGVITPALRRLLGLVMLLFALLTANSIYLAGITLAGQLSDRSLENPFYLGMFLAHLGLGLVLIPTGLAFGALHLRRAWRRPNRYAVRAGLALYGCAILLLLSGLLLTRFGFFEVNDPLIRNVAYWLHLITPLLLGWLFVLHRLAGPPLDWRRGLAWTGAAGLLLAVALAAHLSADPQRLEQPFLPALVQTTGDQPIPSAHLDTDAFCAECHADIHAQSQAGMHRLSSFNNPAYRFSIEEARELMLARDGDVAATQLCAVCHDPVPLMSGNFSSPDYDPDRDPSSQTGISCMSCHAIAAINGPRGNGDFTLVDPPRYPFAFSDNPLLKAINRQLIKAKPGLHKHSLLKPVHKTAEFCSGCHKVHLPYALNHYRWLRGQNHYDSFLLSGVSGHRVDSFYYPPRAVPNCATCHMPLRPSDDPAARDHEGDGRRRVHDHRFAAANTAVPVMVGLDPADNGNRQRREMLAKAVRVDIFGVKEDALDGPLQAPLRPRLATLQPGRRYLFETVVRTVGVGHALTQGTSDSNELWLEVSVRDGQRAIGASGRLDRRGEVDPWAYFLNAYLLDKRGRRIERRNAQDIFVTLYNHQIPPGAAAVVHYALDVPADATGPLQIDVALRYRKFDSRFLRHVEGDGYHGNRLPVTTLATDSVTLPVAASGSAPDAAADTAQQRPPAAPWERWNDYGIALLREGNQGANKGELRGAAEAFARVEQLGRADGPLNLARVYYKEGRIADTAAALRRAAEFDPPAPPWTLAWFSALVEREQGDLDAAIANLSALVEGFPSARARGFDFSRDYRMLNELGRTLFERARQERGDTRRAARQALLGRAEQTLRRVLAADPENATAHYNLALVYSESGRTDLATEHRALHQKYRPDDLAVQRAVSLHRSRNAAANHAAEPVAVYQLRGPDGGSDERYSDPVPTEPTPRGVAAGAKPDTGARLPAG